MNRRTIDASDNASVLNGMRAKNNGKPEQLHILAGANTLTCVEVCEERTTSEARTSELLSGGLLGGISLTTNQARWLHRELGRCLEWLAGYEARCSAEPAGQKGGG